MKNARQSLKRGANALPSADRPSRSESEFPMRRVFLSTCDAAPESFLPPPCIRSLRGFNSLEVAHGFLILPSAWGSAFGCQISLRSQAAKQSAEDEANRFPVGSVIGPVRHAHEFGGIDEQAVVKNLQGVASDYS